MDEIGYPDSTKSHHSDTLMPLNETVNNIKSEDVDDNEVADILTEDKGKETEIKQNRKFSIKAPSLSKSPSFIDNLRNSFRAKTPDNESDGGSIIGEFRKLLSPTAEGESSRPSSRNETGGRLTPDKLTSTLSSIGQSISSKVLGGDSSSSGKPKSAESKTAMLSRGISKVFGIKQIRKPHDEEEAVIWIQNMVRRYLARIKCNKQRTIIKEIQRKSGLLLFWASVSIQRIVRGKLGKRKFQRTLQAKKVFFIS
jgi:hypothetical protein